MSNSIPVVNRNNTLPPLLLPDLRSLSRKHNAILPLTQYDEFFSVKRTRELQEKDENTLDRLATVALKRPKLDTFSNSNALQANRLNVITPPPSAPATAPVSAAISPSPNYVAINETHGHSGLKPEKKSMNTGCNASSNVNSKRQRIGPSCDGCRLKKIKCDAKIEIFLQDEAIIPLISDKLHHILTTEEIRQNWNTLFKDIKLSNKFLKDDKDDKNVLIKHIDKIIHFQPCSSCRKKRNANSRNCCQFSKGFTRADINVFSKIESRLKKNSIYEMDVSDYKNAGF